MIDWMGWRCRAALGLGEGQGVLEEAEGKVRHGMGACVPVGGCQ